MATTDEAPRWMRWWRPGTRLRGSPQQSPMSPPRRLTERNLAEELVPDQAKAVWSSIDPQQGTIAVLIHNQVVNPSTGQLWKGQSVETLARPAFANGLAMAQQEAVDLSQLDDEEYLQHADRACRYANSANAMIEETEKILDDTVECPPGSRCSGRKAIAKHHADQELARQREQDGDSRHQQRPVDRYWIILAALVLSALDIMLLWRPLLNLGSLDSARALTEWGLALAFAGAQAVAIDLIVHKYREEERTNTELRDTIKDHNRSARRGLAQRDLTALAHRPLALDELPAADKRLRTAYRWLLTTATAVGIIAVFRVAFLTRSGGQSIIDATVFGAFVGLFLGLLVLRLGSFACRGNRLGDRLQASVAVVAHIESRIQEGHRRATEARDAARLELTNAEIARARATDTREWVLKSYWQALLLATGWLGLTKPPINLADELVAPRQLEIAATATNQVTAVNDKLNIISQWLTSKQIVVSDPPNQPLTPGTTLARPETTSSTPRLVEPPRPGESGEIVSALHTMDPPPAEPHWLLAAAILAAIGIAFGAAIIAPTPEGGTPTAIAIPVHTKL